MKPLFRMILLAFFVTVTFGLPASGQETNFPEVMFLLDGSGSMWGKAGDQTKIEVAREVMKQLIPKLPEEVKIGLAAYGHRKKGSCEDIEIIIPTGSIDRQALLDKVEKISPKGKTPIAASVEMVVEHLKTKENETTIILVSDGEETCHPDPCGLVKTLKATGIKFILHVVGFDVNQEQQKQLACLADAGGGIYYGAADAASLLTAFEQMQEEVVQKVAVAKAETTSKQTVSRLGKLRVVFPESGSKSLAQIRIIRQKDSKIIKTAETPGNDSTHPLVAGTYEVILGFTNSNYQDPSEIRPIIMEVSGGQTTELRMGVLVFNIADSLQKLPAASVTLRSTDGEYVLETPGKGNDYYFLTAKPLPPGTYSFEYMYKTMPEPAVLAQGLTVEADKETVLTVDSGLKILETDQGLTGFDVLDSLTGQKVLQIRRRWDNSYPLWETFPLVPGKYSIEAYLKGMEQALPVGEIAIEPGQLIEFDTGL